MLTTLYIAAVLALLLFLVWASTHAISQSISLLSGAPYIATQKHEIERLIRKFPLRNDQSVLELGCGDGRVVRAFVKRYGVRGRGIDSNPIVIGKAKLIDFFTKAGVSFETKNILSTDMTGTDLIYLFLFPDIIGKLRNKFLEETKQGTIIISHGFRIPYLVSYNEKVIEGSRFKTYCYKI